MIAIKTHIILTWIYWWFGGFVCCDEFLTIDSHGWSLVQIKIDDSTCLVLWTGMRHDACSLGLFNALKTGTKAVSHCGINQVEPQHLPKWSVSVWKTNGSGYRRFSIDTGHHKLASWVRLWHYFVSTAAEIPTKPPNWFILHHEKPAV